MYAHTLTFATWTAIPEPIRSYCVERVAPGVYGIHRTSILLVCLDEANTAEGLRVLLDDVVANYEHRNARRRELDEQASQRAWADLAAEYGRCHCGSPMGGSDHCPYCGCEQYERTCDMRYTSGEPT